MKKIFTCFLIFAFHLALFSQDGFLADYLKKWENSAAYTIEFAEAFPEELYHFQPSKEEMKFHEQLVHICGNMTWLSSAYLGGIAFERDLSNPPQAKAELIQLLKETFEYVAKTLRNFNAEQLDTEVDFFAGPMSKRQVLMLMSDHVTHHRGQLVVYLRLNDLKPPSYRGW
jgi:uncharacterized damage-inducible protein DinB